MRRWAAVSNGPSAALFDYFGGVDNYYEAVVGAGRTPTTWRCDWWAVADAKQIVELQDRVLGTPRIVTRRLAVSRLPPWMRGMAASWLLCEDIAQSGLTRLGPDGRPDAWWTWSGLIALGALWALVPRGAEVHLFGFDMAGWADYREAGPGGFRSPERWVRERALAAWLIRRIHRDRGVRVRRIRSEADLPRQG